MTPTLVILSPILQGRTGRKNPTAPEALALSSPFFPAPANPAAYAKGTSHHRGGSLLRVDPQTLRIWRVTGHHHVLPFVKMGSGGTGGRVYYRRSDLEAFITRHLCRNTAQADVIPAKADVIPAKAAVIPAKAGIQSPFVLCGARRARRAPSPTGRGRGEGSDRRRRRSNT